MAAVASPWLDSILARLATRPPRAFPRLPGLAPAAVLLPLVARGSGGPAVVLIRRSNDVPTHRGQVALPGGRVDPGDADLEATARRETCEELGVPVDAVRVLARLDDMPTITGYLVTPFVGTIDPGCTPRPDAREVAAVFDLPLDILRGPDFKLRPPWSWIRPPDVQYAGHRIWGATALILAGFAARALGD